MRVFLKKKETWVLVGIIVLYLLLRLPSLTYQPIFADEAIYIRWAQIAKAEPGLRFISLQDGKTPLYMWLMAPFLILFQDPLFAGRFLSVVSGLFTLLGVYAIGSKYFSKRAGLIGAFLVAVTPFMIFFDRMALVDSMLAAFTIWAIYWVLRLSFDQSIKISVILGLTIGASWLTKTPGQVNIALLPLALLFFDFKKIKKNSRLVKFGSFFVLSAFIAGCLYLIQKIDPNFHQLSARNSDYVHPWSRLLIYPFDPLVVHFQDTIRFSLPFFGPLLLILPFIIWFVFFKKNEQSSSSSRVAILLFLWSVLPFVYELYFIKAFTARYVLYNIPPILILSGWVLDSTKKTVLQIAGGFLLLLVMFWSLYFVYPLFTNLNALPLSQEERRGYLEDWTAGYGLKEIANYLISQSTNQQIVVGTEGSFGTLPDGMVIYLDKYFHQSQVPKIIVIGDGPQVTDTLEKDALQKPTFFIANKSRYPSPQLGLDLIHEYPKITGSDLPPDSILFYKVNPIESSK